MSPAQNIPRSPEPVGTYHMAFSMKLANMAGGLESGSRRVKYQQEDQLQVDDACMHHIACTCTVYGTKGRISFK